MTASKDDRLKSVLEGGKLSKKPKPIKKVAKETVESPLIVSTEDHSKLPLTSDQSAAWAKLYYWLTDPEADPFFELKGYAGTGKTFLQKKLLTIPGLNIHFTSPTNKATKVMSKMLKVPCVTTFSLLGIRMENDDDQVVLKLPEKLPYLGINPIIVVDEAGVASKPLVNLLLKCVKRLGAKLLLVGDPAQLPPVQERVSSCWGLAEPKNRSLLREVRRFENQLLDFATHLREFIRRDIYPESLIIPNDYDSSGGIRRLPSLSAFTEAFLRPATSPTFFDERKILAWRNVTVNEYNRLIRKRLGFRQPYEVGERILVSSPVKEFGKVTHTIDTEFVVNSVDESYLTVSYQETTHSETKYIDLPVYCLEVAFPETPDQSCFTLKVARNEQHALSIFRKLADLAKNSSNDQRERKFFWDQFWRNKDNLHSVRYNYSLTVHRSQGSTYKSVFVDSVDILSNPEPLEATRCLYVGFTRPSKFAITY